MFLKDTIASTRELSLDTAFLGTLSTQQQSSWSVDLYIRNHKVHFKLDTGAEVTAISEGVYRSLGKVPLKKSTYGPARQKLKVIGQIEEQLSYHQNTLMQTIFVIQNLKVNLLGFPAITTLKILIWVNAIGAQEQDIKKQFPKLFKGLGDLGEEYHIRLKEGAVPYCLYTPRNVPIPLRSKVLEELNKMESMGVISKVSEPTEWCARMVVVPKWSSMDLC